jgi:hypothetical protein
VHVCILFVGVNACACVRVPVCVCMQVCFACAHVCALCVGVVYILCMCSYGIKKARNQELSALNELTFLLFLFNTL